MDAGAVDPVISICACRLVVMASASGDGVVVTDAGGQDCSVVAAEGVVFITSAARQSLSVAGVSVSGQ